MAPTVLVVEDDPVIIDLLTLTLELEGWTVRKAMDADTALAMVHEDRPDVVLSDIMMPGTSGLALAADITGDPATADIPVVLLSARALPAEVAEGIAAGATDYVTKPFDPDNLVDRLQAVVDGVVRRQVGGADGGTAP
ncbi:response regulator [Iamia majanohamensis]|uniref:Response regulator n=1 Tax=Iamia majanohamensis TaxID=467976 RepID=A0AAE9YFS4_9ACTN|nr:response regulator [Iamia majanohamensis]WCO67742.1 response regulator [Iamia majanohamensis]